MLEAFLFFSAQYAFFHSKYIDNLEQINKQCCVTNIDSLSTAPLYESLNLGGNPHN